MATPPQYIFVHVAVHDGMARGKQINIIPSRDHCWGCNGGYEQLVCFMENVVDNTFRSGGDDGILTWKHFSHY